MARLSCIRRSEQAMSFMILFRSEALSIQPAGNDNGQGKNYMIHTPLSMFGKGVVAVVAGL